MIRLFINALAASAGGGLTYVRNIVPLLSSRRDVEATVVLAAGLREELGRPENVRLLPVNSPGNTARRFWFEQRRLPALLRQCHADVLLSVGNFALWNSPVPQILLSRNALYTSSDFERDLRQRGDYRLWIDNVLKSALARASIQRADATVAPSRSFAEELRQWSGAPVEAIHHGFNRNAFLRGSSPLPTAIEEQLAASEGALRLLFVSHYNYYRNFETLLRAIPIVRDEFAPRKVRLFLTCQLKSEANPGSYRASGAADLVKGLGIRENVVELGAVPYRLLHHVYRRCDLYVTPAYAESFAHPLVEAMSCGIPIAASDVPVHREICGCAAAYFSRFSPAELARVLIQITESPEFADKLRIAGTVQSSQFSWETHLDKVLELAGRLVSAQKRIS
jgi:glycosyltransferase involved in cell wall biosynthesis